jgi:hypothetical protein
VFAEDHAINVNDEKLQVVEAASAFARHLRVQPLEFDISRPPLKGPITLLGSH